MDENYSGDVDPMEFFKLMQMIEKGSNGNHYTKEEISECFHLLDSNDDGFIVAKEFLDRLLYFEIIKDRESASKLWDDFLVHYDLNNDKKICYGEFLKAACASHVAILSLGAPLLPPDDPCLSRMCATCR